MRDFRIFCIGFVTSGMLHTLLDLIDSLKHRSGNGPPVPPTCRFPLVRSPSSRSGKGSRHNTWRARA